MRVDTSMHVCSGRKKKKHSPLFHHFPFFLGGGKFPEVRLDELHGPELEMQECVAGE